MFKSFRHASHEHAYQHYARQMNSWRRRPKYNVPVNIADKEGYYEVTVYATGFDKENIKLKISGDELFITGTRTVDEKEIPEFIKQEFPVRIFERVIRLGEGIDTDSISARQENSILYIKLPKNADAKKFSREIEVS